MMEHNFDPYALLEQIQVNQKQLDINFHGVVNSHNHMNKRLTDVESRSDLNQQTINNVLDSLQNQQKLLMALFEELGKLQAVNKEQGQ
jgi:adenylate kinase family enzyme